MKSTTKKYLVIIAVAMSILSSCKKSFLENTPEDVLTRQEYVKDLKSLNQYFKGVYIDLAEYTFGRYEALHADLIADNLKPKTDALGQIYNWTQIAEESYPLGSQSISSVNTNHVFKTCYHVIRECNFVIENIAIYGNENTVLADNILGQAYAIRALLHHQLVKIYAQPYNFTSTGNHPGVPYVLTVDFTKPLKRGTVSEDYINIIDDLNKAQSLINESQQNKLYFTRIAAKALLARVYFYKGDYENAKKLSVEVFNNVPIIPNSDYPTKLFTANNAESLFEMAPHQDKYTTVFPGYALYEEKDFAVTVDLINILNERPSDRRNSWVEYDSDLKLWFATKFQKGVVPDFYSVAAAYYQPVIRSSEMVLIAAESYARTGDEPTARRYLDNIRMRADASASPSNSTGAALINAIIKERRKEFCFENDRMFDLLRTGNGVFRTDADVPPAIKTLPFPSDKAISPFPLNDLTYYNFIQNPSY